MRQKEKRYTLRFKGDPDFKAPDLPREGFVTEYEAEEHAKVYYFIRYMKGEIEVAEIQ